MRYIDSRKCKAFSLVKICFAYLTLYILGEENTNEFGIFFISRTVWGIHQTSHAQMAAKVRTAVQSECFLGYLSRLLQACEF